MRRGAGTGNSPERVPIQSGFGVITGREFSREWVTAYIRGKVIFFNLLEVGDG